MCYNKTIHILILFTYEIHIFLPNTFHRIFYKNIILAEICFIYNIMRIEIQKSIQ
jgi:hypothetical protein